MADIIHSRQYARDWSLNNDHEPGRLSPYFSKTWGRDALSPDTLDRGGCPWTTPGSAPACDSGPSIVVLAARTRRATTRG